MNRANRYLLKHFSELFSSLFFILFFITSIIFFIKLTALTAIIKMDFLDLGTLYLYLLPRTLVYTLPLTFFIALCITLFNLSKENETTVLFTLGYNPRKIAKLFLSLSALLSVVLILDIFVLIPISKQLNTNFFEYKKAEAKFNIKANEFGQRFSDWLVYIEHGDNQKLYEGVTMYRATSGNDKEKLIVSQNAAIENGDGKLRLNLASGKIFQFDKDSIDQTNFERMFINSVPKTPMSVIQSIEEYWSGVYKDKKRAYDLSFFILIALFPLATVLIALSIGIVTYRYDKGSIYFFMFLTTAIYLAATTLFSTWHPQSAPLIVFALAFVIALVIYNKRIRAVY